MATLVGAVIWVALRWSDPTKRRIQLIRAAAAGVVIGAVVIGLGSVVYDPFVD